MHARKRMHGTHVRSRIVGSNVPPAERIACGVAGAGLVAAAIFARRIPGIARLPIGGIGAALVVRALTGRSPLYRARAIRREGVRVRKAVTIQGTPRHVYEVWRDLEKLPRILGHVTSVTVEGGRISRWVAEVGGKRLAWRAEIVEESPGRRLRWKSLPGGDVRTEGEIDLHEASGDRGTIVEVKLSYFPPGGLLVASTFLGFLRKLSELALAADLARLQQLVETGEIAVGARRLDDVEDRDRIATTVVPVLAPPAATTAQTSHWEPVTAESNRGVR